MKACDISFKTKKDTAEQQECKKIKTSKNIAFNTKATKGLLKAGG